MLHVTEDQYRDCLNFYDQKVKLYKHRVEDDAATLQQVTEINKEVLEVKLNDFKTVIDDLLGVAEKGSTSAGGGSAMGAPGAHGGGFSGIISGNTSGRSNQNQSTSNKQMFSNMQKKTTQQLPQRATSIHVPAGISPTYAIPTAGTHTITANPPFRNLFEEEESMGEEQQLPDQSPQFKNM